MMARKPKNINRIRARVERVAFFMLSSY